MHDAVVSHIRNHDNFVLIAHTSPDGDTLGSALALLRALEKLQKKALVVCENGMPASLSFMPGSDKLSKTADNEGEYTAIAIDCADISRMGACDSCFKNAKHTINIDHHATNKGYAQINDIVPHAAAVGESIWQIIGELGVEPDKEMAQCIYTAISTDTGNFCYANTTPDTFKTAVELLELGFDLNTTSSKLFRTRSLSKTRMICKCIENLELFFDDQICVSTISKAEMDSIGSDESETEGMIDFIRDIETVKIAVFMREVSQSVYKVSLRSKVDINVSTVAQQFGGGGHKLAAGCTIEESAEKTKEKIITALSGFFS